MTDPTPYPLPAVRIHADYASTDGRVPDSLTIEYAERPSLDHIGTAITMLADVADRRDYAIAIEPRPLSELRPAPKDNR